MRSLPQPSRFIGGIPMRSRIWIGVVAAGLAAFLTVIIKKQRERAEAERMMVWG